MNTTFNANPNYSEVIIMVNINGTSYTIGKVKYDYRTFDEVRKRILSETSAIRPSDEFVKLLNEHFSNYNYITEDDCKNARVDFVFVDSVPMITF